MVWWRLPVGQDNEATSQGPPGQETILPEALVRRVEYEDWDGLIMRIKDLEDVVAVMASVLSEHGVVVRRENGKIVIIRV
jgi:hypothetical protein